MLEILNHLRSQIKNSKRLFMKTKITQNFLCSCFYDLRLQYNSVLYANVKFS